MREYNLTYGKLTKRIKSKYDLINTEKDPSKVKSFIKSTPISINNFQDLVMEVAELSYRNRDVLLFFRGQKTNHKKRKFTSLLPSIYRNNIKSRKDAFERLDDFSKRLIIALENDRNIEKEELKEIKNIKLLQHSILQHYGVCETPLLDITQSLRVACSFAFLKNDDKVIDKQNNEGYIYVLALPYITGRISLDSEEYITNVRLLSINTSISKRPFFQEGYLVQSEFVDEYNCELKDLDFNKRLIAIYKINNEKNFWKNECQIEENLLYPLDDKMKMLCSQL